jgi:hypothetical protein
MRRMGLLTYAVVLSLVCGTRAFGQQPGATGSDGSSSQAATGGTTPNISGTGTPGFLAAWTTTTNLGNSIVFQRFGNIGVGTQSPAAKLDVNGTGKFHGLVTFASGQAFPGTASLGANTFSGSQSVTGNVTASGMVQGSVVNATISFNLGGAPFAFGSAGSGNAFLGFAGNSTTNSAANTATGQAALVSNSTGNQNTANGSSALQSNTEGNENVAIGSNALSNNTTGSANAAIGFDALFSNTGSFNTAVGNVALESNTSGYANTALGGGALGNNTTAGGNTAAGASALFPNTTGSLNTAVGDYAGVYYDGQTNMYLPTTGSNSTFIGANATATVDGLTNASAIGYDAQVNASNSLVLGSPQSVNGSANTMVGVDVGNPSNIFTVLQGGGHAISDGWDVYSSRRWKSDIKPLHDALAKVERLRGVEYTYTMSGNRNIGMIAEEVGKVVPEVVSYEDNGKDARGIDYARLTTLLVEAMKQQEAEIRQEQIRINKLESEVRALRREKK